MMRRSHRKSRNGCLECKKRHIKCDETRPQCINCTTVQRDCQYTTPWIITETSPSDRSVSPQNPALGTSPTPGGGGGPAHSPAPSSSTSAAAFPELHPFTPAEEPHSRVDMVHMELLHHYITRTSLYPLGDESMKEIVMTIALREPYVMHSLLALAAHHISVTRPEQHAYYHNLAMQLQTRALSLFNSIDLSLIGDSVERRVPLFIFSSVLGFHALCDMLTYRDPGFQSAYERFVAYLRLHRGLHTVMEGHWDNLRATDLGMIFDVMVPRLFHLDAKGTECDEIRAKLRASSLDEEEITAALKAVEMVQWVFDARPKAESRAYVLCSWVAMLPRPFIRMLEEGRREAVAVLAYYFLAMHYCRDVWMIGGAGRHLLTLLVDHFRADGEWYAWVETPYRALQESLLAEAASASSSSTTPNQSPADDPMTDANFPGSGASLSALPVRPAPPGPASHSEPSC